MSSASQSIFNPDLTLRQCCHHIDHERCPCEQRERSRRPRRRRRYRLRALNSPSFHASTVSPALRAPRYPSHSYHADPRACSRPGVGLALHWLCPVSILFLICYSYVNSILGVATGSLPAVSMARCCNGDQAVSIISRFGLWVIIRGVSGRHQSLVCYMKGVLVRTQGYIIIALMSGLFLQTRSHGYTVHQRLLSVVYAGCLLLCMTSKHPDSRTDSSLIAMMIMVVRAC